MMEKRGSSHWVSCLMAVEVPQILASVFRAGRSYFSVEPMSHELFATREVPTTHIEAVAMNDVVEKDTVGRIWRYCEKNLIGTVRHAERREQSIISPNVDRNSYLIEWPIPRVITAVGGVGFEDRQDSIVQG